MTLVKPSYRSSYLGPKAHPTLGFQVFRCTELGCLTFWALSFRHAKALGFRRFWGHGPLFVEFGAAGDSADQSQSHALTVPPKHSLAIAYGSGFSDGQKLKSKPRQSFCEILRHSESHSDSGGDQSN